MLHPAGDAGEDGFGDVLFKKRKAAGLTDGVREEAAERGADCGERDQEEDVGVGGGEDDEEDVGDAGDGKWDEGAVDRRDGQKADETHVAHKVHEAAVGVLSMGVRARGGDGLEDERRREGGERGCHAGDMTLAQMGKSRRVLRGSSEKSVDGFARHGEGIADGYRTKGLSVLKVFRKENRTIGSLCCNDDQGIPELDTVLLLDGQCFFEILSIGSNDVEKL